MNGTKEFYVEKFDKEKSIIIYGAGVFGEYAVRGLEQWNLTPLFICDRAKSGKKYFNIDIVSPEKLIQHTNEIVLIAVGLQFHEVKNYLYEIGCTNCFSIYDFIFEQCKFKYEQLSIQGRDIYYYKKLYKFGMNDNGDNKIRLSSLDLVITQRCSLRCEGCSNLMQYYQRPIDIPISLLKSSLENLLNCVDEIMDLRIIGGEPFMNKDIGEILEYCIQYEKILNISIHTNATIVPSEGIVDIMKNRKIKVEMTDYGTLSIGLNKFIALMEHEKIRYHVAVWDEWHDLGKLECHHRSTHELKKVYKDCYCNYIPTLLEGRLYICPYSANGRSLEAVPINEADMVDFSECSLTKDELRYKTKKLLYEKEFDEACNYCNGRNNQMAVIKPAIQSKAPLAYKKFQ